MGSRVVWDVGEDAWFPDAPVVLMFDDSVLSIDFRELNVLELVWSSDMPSQVPDWPGFDLEWRDNAMPPLNRFVEDELARVSVVEYLLKTQLVGDENGGVNRAWLLSGLLFGFADGVFEVYNALDENGVSGELPNPVSSRQHELG